MKIQVWYLEMWRSRKALEATRKGRILSSLEASTSQNKHQNDLIGCRSFTSTTSGAPMIHFDSVICAKFGHKRYPGICRISRSFRFFALYNSFILFYICISTTMDLKNYYITKSAVGLLYPLQMACSGE